MDEFVILILSIVAAYAVGYTAGKHGLEFFFD